MKNVLLLLSVFFVNIGIFAQEKTTEEKATQLTERMKEQIGFSDETKEKVQEINLGFAKKTEEIKAGSSSKLTKVKELKTADEERDAKLKEVLTEEEYKKFKDKKSDNRKEMKERFKANRSK